MGVGPPAPAARGLIFLAASSTTHRNSHDPSLRIAIACLAVAAFFGATTSASAEPPEVGVQDEAVFVHGSDIGREAGLDSARQKGATDIRAGIDWETNDFSAHDGLVSAAAARGLRVQLTLTPAPGWVRPPAAPTSTSRSPPPSPSSPAGWPATSAGACSATRS